MAATDGQKNRRKICDIDFCAWDMVRFVMLCNSGAQVGYITQREMVDFSMLAARRVQQHYRSWRELAGHFLLARWYWKATDKRHLITHILFKKAITSLLKEQGVRGVLYPGIPHYLKGQRLHLPGLVA